MEIRGKVVAVLPEQRGQGSKGEWVRHSFVVEYTENGFTSKLCLDVQGDKWEKMASGVVVGNSVLARFNVSSREWNGRWYTSAACFYCSVLDGAGGHGEESASSKGNIDDMF